jgi:hypothetical protein
MELHELVAGVDSKETFLTFVAALTADWDASRVSELSSPSSPYGPNALGWENANLGEFLEALKSWSEDMGDRIPENPSWQIFAQMLMAAKIYE